MSRFRTLCYHATAYDSGVIRPGPSAQEEPPLSTQRDQAQALLAAIVASSGDAIISTDSRGRITTWNPAAERLYGIIAADAIGRSGDLTVPPEHEEERLHFLARVTATATPQRLQTRRRGPDGSLVDVELVAATIRDPAGALTGYVSVVRDISTQKRAEAELAELMTQLRDTNRQLEILNATRSDFVATISHEFRTPLTSIQGFGEVLATEELPPEEVHTLARTINQNAARLGRLIGDVLDLEALEAGRWQIRRDPLSLNRLVIRVLDAMQPLTAGHCLATKLDPALPAVRGDADLLERVITNLVSNAVKYSPSSGPITLATAPRQDGVELTVIDEGMGVPDAHRETIFARYGRIARPEQYGIEGTGLGLPIARHILEIHNGRIWVEPNDPAGSIFHVVLPADAEPPPAM